jgi:fatty-acyl-CoA synthase
MVQKWYKETNSTWGDVLNEAAAQCPEKPFVKFKDKTVTYQEFRNNVDAFAKGLLKLGVQKGDNIALWMGNCLEWMYAQFAIYKLGCSMVPLYTRWRRVEIEYALRQSDATTLIMEENFLGGKIDAFGILNELIPTLSALAAQELKADKFPALKRVVFIGKNRPKGAFDYFEVMDLGKAKELDDKLRLIEDSVDPFDVMNIMYTSGTTGFPKGGMSMHRNNMATVYLWAGERIKIKETDRVLNNFPLYSNFGCFVIYFTLYFRAFMVLVETYDPAETLEIIDKEKITGIFGSPPMFAMLMDHPDFKKRDVSSLQKGVIGGSPVAPSLFKRIYNEMGVKGLITAYGLSEAGAVSNTTLQDDPLEIKARTVGIPIPSYRVRVVDPNTEETMPTGGQGEIWFKDVYTGSGCGKGYYNMPDKTAEANTKDGWFRTGDLGTIDDKGYLTITGRLKDMVLVGGFNVYPVEIENFLITHPKIQQAFVLGVPDKRLDEAVMAYVVLKKDQTATEQEIINFCKENIANYKVPKYVRFIDISEVPFSGHEKVQKYKLRERAVQELKLT